MSSLKKEVLPLLTKNHIFICVLFVSLTSCVNNIEEVENITNKKADPTIDIGTDITITYSDSSIVQVFLKSPLVEKHNNVTEPKEVFPKGIEITFMDRYGKPNAWLKSDEAVRKTNLGKMTAKGNVVFYNTQQDKLETSELIWDENTHMLSTEKFVKVSRPSSRDTTYGFGFETDEKFETITIKRKIQSKLDASKLRG
jgi:LPS export ABC transporter protein LptC